LDIYGTNIFPNIVNYFKGQNRKTSYDAVSNYILFYVGALRNREVDFVAKKADRIIYLQSAYQLSVESTVEREYSALEAIGDNFEKLVVSLDEIVLPLRGGIKHLQAWNLYEYIK
jgi:uncharacterized protein